MRRPLLALVAALALAGSAAAQTPPANPTSPAQTSTQSPDGAAGTRAAARGAAIRVHRPDLSVSIRCADGETTRACADTVSLLIEKLAATPSSSARSGGEGGERGFYRDRERPRGGYRDRDGDRYGGEDRYRD